MPMIMMMKTMKKMSYNLYLDDDKDPDFSYFKAYDKTYKELKWIVVRTSDEFKKTLKDRGIPDVMSFDFQLNEKEADGLTCAQFLKDLCDAQNVPYPKIKVHSNWPGVVGKFYELFEK